jgi:mannose-1-phosphate guanylyltransferase
MMADNYYALIMAGGGGTRLWPLSRRGSPKQSVGLIGGRTLFEISVERILPLFPAQRIMVVTTEEQKAVLRKQASQLDHSSYLLEPQPKGTASVVGLAAIALRRRDPQAVMAVLTADHYIKDVARFHALLLAAYEAAQAGHLVTLGITPTYAATGYGYIEQGKELGSFHGQKAFRVKSFTEKPARAQAERYLAEGGFSWNSGMFVWKVQRILEEIERLMPDLYRALLRVDTMLGHPDEKEHLAAIWSELQSQTVDYGIMEKAEGVVVFSAEGLGWVDIGGWNRLIDLAEADERGNLFLAPQVLALDTSDTLVYQDKESGSGKLIALLGLHGMVIVDAGEAILVCPAERAEDVRRLVEALKELGLEEYL